MEGVLSLLLTMGSMMGTEPGTELTSDIQRIEFSGHLGANVARLRDGRLVSTYMEDRSREQALVAGAEQRAFIRYSVDHGLTWGEPKEAYSYPVGRGTTGGAYLLVDRHGNLHSFDLRFFHFPKQGDPRAAAVSELHHNISRDGGKTWSAPKKVDFGHLYAGALNSVLELKSGRLLVALNYATDHYLSHGRGEYEYRCVAVYSDDSGETWRIGSDNISVPLGPFTGHHGAIEPVMVELGDGRVWMIIRTQTYRFYQSFSSDGGRTWTRPEPTQIRAPNAPAGVLRLSDGRIVLCWNDLSQYPGEVLRNGRQYLHVAISGDEGKTWSPSKLIAQRYEEEDPDTQVRYPYLCETADRHLLVLYSRVSEEARGTELVRIDPNRISR